MSTAGNNIPGYYDSFVFKTLYLSIIHPTLFPPNDSSKKKMVKTTDVPLEETTLVK
jgi:hypothetical protein